MKAKKLFVCGLTTLATVALASCGGNDDLENRIKAVQKVANQGIATVSGVDMIANSATPTRLNANNSESISLAKQSQTKIGGKTYTVQIEWSYDQSKYGKPVSEDKTSSSCVYKWEDSSTDDTHLYVGFNYSLEKEQSFDFDGVLTCGDGATASVHYDCTLSILELTFTEMSHTEFYEVGDVDGKTRFINWQNAAGRNKDYYYNNGHKITIRGKLTYLAPDKNFAYLVNGNKVISLYHIDLLSDPSVFVVGKYYETSCYIASYFGSVQCSNMSQIYELTEEEAIEKGVETIDTTPIDLTGKQMNGVFGTDDRINQFSDYHHRMGTISGTFVSGISESTNGKGRFTFKLRTADGTEVVIQHNYHVDSGSGTIGNAIIDKVLNAGTKTITVTGALTYNSTNETAPDSFEPGNEGGWTLVPLSADDVTVA